MSCFINLANSYIFVGFTNHRIKLILLNDINLNYLSHVALVLASYCSFRPETGLSSLNNAFCIEDGGITKLWELHHYDTTLSFLSLPIVSLEKIEHPFLKPWLGRAKPVQ